MDLSGNYGQLSQLGTLTARFYNLRDSRTRGIAAASRNYGTGPRAGLAFIAGKVLKAEQQQVIQAESVSRANHGAL